MKYAAVLVAGLVCASAFASDPGQPLDCSDWVFVEPGHSCVTVLPANCSSDFCSVHLNGPDERGVNRAADNQGNLYLVRRVLTEGSCDPNQLFGRVELVRLDPAGLEHVVGYMPDRNYTPTNGACSAHDLAFPTRDPSFYNVSGPMAGVLTFLPTAGRFVISLTSWSPSSNVQPYGPQVWLGAITGFPTLFEVLQSYTPQPAQLGFAVPSMPEGLPAVDHFDTYTGPLTHPLDFTQAQPLACNYPATPPSVGDYLTVADPLPDPAPGTGRYYITATTYHGQTRYGRKATAGVQSGRDPALLPSCQVP